MELYHEMFKRFGEAKTPEDKVRVLQQFTMTRGGSRLPEFFNNAFNPGVVFDISGVPSYKASNLPEGLNDSYLHQELPKLYIFITGHPRRKAKLTLKKEQAILAQTLSYLHAAEAKILVAMIEKKLPALVPGMTAKVAKEAFPGLPFTLDAPAASVAAKVVAKKTKTKDTTHA